jgi:hypothetical protein
MSRSRSRERTRLRARPVILFLHGHGIVLATGRPVSRLSVGIVVLLAALAAPGCCGGLGDSDYLTLSIGVQRSELVPRWGGTMEYPREGLTFLVQRPAGRRLAGEPLEVYDQSGSTPFVVPRVDTTIDNATRDGCGTSDIATYDLSVLPLGTYLLVHRRASGTGDEINCSPECQFVEFDGDEALVTTLVIR